MYKQLFLLFLCFSPLLLMSQLREARRSTVQQTGFENARTLSFPSFQQTSSAGSCNTWTFQTGLSSLKTEKPSDIVQLPSSCYIIGGSCSSGSNLSGRLIKLSEDGSLLASKELTLGGNGVEVKRLYYFSIGKLYGIGTITDALNGTTPVLFNIDTVSLSIQSVFSFDVNNGPVNWKGFDLTENPMDSSLFVLLNNDSLINVTKFRPDLSTTIWSKTYRPKNAPRPVGIGIEALDVYVAWNETDSGYSKGVVANLDPVTGNFRWGSKVGQPSQGVNIELQGMCVINLRPRFTALEYNNASTQFIRINYEVFAYPTFKEYFTIAGLTPSTASFSQQNEWGESLAVQQNPGSSDITIVQTFPDNDNNSPIRASVVSYPSGVQLRRQRHSFDGGNITLAESAGTIFLSKADSIITLPSCNTSPLSASSTRTLNKLAYLPDTLSPGSLLFQISPITIQENDLPVTTTVYCKTQYCPTVKEPDSCQRTFFKEYRNSTNSITANGIMKLGDNLLLSGFARSLPYSGRGEFTLVKMDTSGHVKNARFIWGPNVSAYKTIPLRDGNFLVTGTVGSTFNFAEPFLAKLNPQFNILWQQKLTAIPFLNGIADVVESSEGDLYCYLIDHETTNAECRDIIKLTSTGQPVWIRKFNTGPNNFAGTGEFIAAIVELGDNIVLKYNEETGDMSPHLMSLKKSDGSINWVRKFQMAGPYGGSNSYALSSLVSDETNLYMLGRTQGKDLFLKIRPDGTVALAKKVTSATVYASKMSLKSNGRLLVDAGNTSPSINGVLEMDTSFRVLRSQYMRLPRFGGSGGVVDVNDSLVYEAGSLWNDDPYWSSICFQKYNFNSSFSSCMVTDPVFVLDSVNQQISLKTVPQLSISLPTVSNANAAVYPLNVSYAAYYCGNNPVCSGVQLKGATKICDSSNVYTYKAEKNAGCSGFVIWRLDTAARQVKIISVTDSVLQLKVMNGGRFKIHSKVFASCGWLEDSITVEASPQNGSLNLGRDTILCAGNSVTLHAGPGFASYQWQDGSTDSVFTVNSPGIYHVQVSSCANVLYDTVVVSPHPPIQFTAGADRTKCNSDTLHLTATAGFLAYSWSPDYRISSSTANFIVVNPLADTAYFIKAEKSPGCFVYDTVRIKVYTSPKIDLGRDTSFCAESSILLSAPSSFSTFLWNTGETSQQISVSKPGDFRVLATTTEGCVSGDTLSVKAVYPLPVLALDKNPALCYGSNRSLDPGPFSSYLWQDGSTRRTYPARSTGTFYVTVSDVHGCINTDTVLIKTLLPLPSAFLPQDTTLCTYETLSLKPTTSFQQYLWNNGAAASSINISQPGLYWLEATDNKGCKGKDSIIVSSKECLEGVYVPNAFTPNNDTHNDQFRVLAFGNIKNFEFTIYNRWGQAIFRTNDRFKGWDGKLAGVEQRSDVYVWTCRYRFEGQVERFEKGTFTLIR